MEPVLIADLMSSEDSEYEDVTEHVQEQSSGSELEDVPTVKKEVNKAQASRGVAKCSVWWTVLIEK